MVSVWRARAGYAAVERVESAAERDSLRIANWNIERLLPSEGRVAAIQEHISRIDADMWILTETHQAFSPGVEYDSVCSGPPDRESSPGERWSAIWSRLPIEPLPAFVSDPARCSAARILHPEIGEVVVHACVLPWGGSEWQGYHSRGGLAFEMALDMYSRDWLSLRDEFPDSTLVVAGDFNQSLVERHYYGSNRQRALLEAALESVGLVAVTAGEGDPVARDSAPYACIDHICISSSPSAMIGPTIRWPETARPDLRLSDHFGVAVECSSDANEQGTST
jgi:endonuclease/exonuclease/phosphatase family metal-dependent hydrolase